MGRGLRVEGYAMKVPPQSDMAKHEESIEYDTGIRTLSMAYSRTKAAVLGLKLIRMGRPAMMGA